MFIHQYNGHNITQLTESAKISKFDVPAGYVNTTEVCKACDKLWADYARLESTKSYWERLSLDMGIPISNLVIIVKGRADKIPQGTWTHPEIAIDCAQWVNVDFRIWANRTLRQVMTGQVPQIEPTPTQLTLPTPQEVSEVLNLTFGSTGIHPNLIAGAFLNTVVKYHPSYALLAETAKPLLSVTVEDELVTPTRLGELLADKTGEKWSARRVNKLLLSLGFQEQSPEGKNPTYLPTEKGKQYSQLVLDTAKGRDKTVQHLRWYPSVLEAIEVKDCHPELEDASNIGLDVIQARADKSEIIETLSWLLDILQTMHNSAPPFNASELEAIEKQQKKVNRLIESIKKY